MQLGWQWANGYVYWDVLKVDDVRSEVADIPFYLFSKDTIVESSNAAKEVLKRIGRIISVRTEIEYHSRYSPVTPAAWKWSCASIMGEFRIFEIKKQRSQFSPLSFHNT